MVIPLLWVKTRCADKLAAEHYNIHTCTNIPFGSVRKNHVTKQNGRHKVPGACVNKACIMLVSCLTGVNNNILKVLVTFENSIDFNEYFHVYKKKYPASSGQHIFIILVPFNSFKS